MFDISILLLHLDGAAPKKKKDVIYFLKAMTNTYTVLAVFVFVQMERSGVEISQVGRQVQIRVCSSQVQAKAHCASAEECPHSLPFFCTHCFTINNHSCSISKHICVATQPTHFKSCYNVRPLFKCSGMLLEIVPAQQ